MNRLSLSLCLATSCLFSLVTPNIARAEWVEVYRDRDIAIEVLPNGIERYGNGVIKYFSSTKRRVPRNGIKATIAVETVDCDRQLYRFDRISRYDSRGSLVAVQTETKWKLILAGSVQDAIASQMCQLSEP